MCLTITEHQLTNGRKALIGVMRHPVDPYVWVATVNTGAGDAVYRIEDTIADGYRVVKVGGDGTEYQVRIGDRGGGRHAPVTTTNTGVGSAVTLRLAERSPDTGKPPAPAWGTARRERWRRHTLTHPWTTTGSARPR